MKITRNNYEIYFLDFYDGNLNVEDKVELQAFVESNSDLKSEFENFENLTIQGETLNFSDKKDLKKIPENSLFEISDFEYLCVSDIENDISDEQKSNLLNQIKTSTEKRFIYKTIAKTKLHADLSIKYPLKSRIKKFAIGFDRHFIYKLSAAAVLLILIGFSIRFFYSDTNIDQNNTANLSITKNKLTIDYFSMLYKQEFKKTAPPEKQNIESPIIQTANTDNSITFSEIITDTALVLTASFENLPIRNEIFTTSPIVLQKYQFKSKQIKEKKERINIFWAVAEKTLKIWNFSTNGKIEMQNKYNDYGQIEKLTVYSSNFKFSKTYRKF
jgi:hypothetical protein